MAGHPLRPATRRRLGRPSPHQQADRPRAHPPPEKPFPKTPCEEKGIPGIRPRFQGLSRSEGQVTHVLLTRSPLIHQMQAPSFIVRLACVKHAASVRPEPGSNSPQKTCKRAKTDSTKKHTTNQKNQPAMQTKKPKHPTPKKGQTSRTPQNMSDTLSSTQGAFLHPVRFAFQLFPRRGNFFSLACEVHSVKSAEGFLRHIRFRSLLPKTSSHLRKHPLGFPNSSATGKKITQLQTPCQTEVRRRASQGTFRCYSAVFSQLATMPAVTSDAKGNGGHILRTLCTP